VFGEIECTPEMPDLTPTIVVFDSGLGGLTVFCEVAAVRPDARYIYLADDKAFPYGDLPEAALIDRVNKVVGEEIVRSAPDLVIIACNTASTLALAHVRARFKVPFVGTVPAIKPACAKSRSKLVSVLGTRATVSREYTQGLIREFAQGCDVTLVGAGNLAALAETKLNGGMVDDAAITAEIAPCFVEKGGARTDAVVLACTHYPLLLGRLRRLAPWPVDWLDPAPAIARRVVDLLGPPQRRNQPAPARFAFTSGKAPSAALTRALAGLGFAATETA
jgi:glutamate racemase